VRNTLLLFFNLNSYLVIKKEKLLMFLCAQILSSSATEQKAKLDLVWILHILCVFLIVLLDSKSHLLVITLGGEPFSIFRYLIII